MKKEKPTKKKPSDYEIYSFRLSKKDREEIRKLLERAYQKLNDGDAESWKINYNDILVKVLKEGIPKLTRNDFQ